MADFPANPSVGDTFTSSDGTVWEWDGYSWRSEGGLGGGSAPSANGVPTHPADGSKYGLDATGVGNATLVWRRYVDQSHFMTFGASMSARWSGGPFSGSSTAEKGYTGAVSLSYSVTQPTYYSITDSYDAKLNGSFITLSGGSGSGSTGNSTTGGTYSGSASEPATFSVTMKSNTNETVTDTDALSWQWRVYWGADASTSLTEAQVEALTSSQLKSGRTGTYTITATGGKYLYICYPASFGAATQFTVNGFVTTFQLLTSTLSVTNTYGATTDYRVYRSEDLQNGSGIPVVVS